MYRFFSPLLFMMSVVVMVAALADRSASAELDALLPESTDDAVTICHPLTSREGNVDVVVYRISPRQNELIGEHRAHGDVVLEPSSDSAACPGNVIHIDRL